MKNLRERTQRNIDLLVYRFAGILQEVGFSEECSFEYAANFVIGLNQEEFERELSDVTIH